MHSIKEVDLLAVKMNLLTKQVEHYEKMSTQETLKAMDSNITCDVYGDVGHSRNACPKTQEDLNFVNNDNEFHPQQHQGWNQHSNNQEGNNYYSSQHLNNQGNSYAFLKDLVYSQS